MKTITNGSKVKSEVLLVYEQVDGNKVIEEYLLFKGTEAVQESMKINLQSLERMALVVYSLKVNATNKLYIGLNLEKYYRRNNMLTEGGYVKVPKDIFTKAKQVNDSFKK